MLHPISANAKKVGKVIAVTNVAHVVHVNMAAVKGLAIAFVKLVGSGPTVTYVSSLSKQPHTLKRVLGLILRHIFSYLSCFTASKPCEIYGKKCELNGGICNSTRSGDFYVCKCPSNRRGKDCEEVFSLCHSSPCLNGGTCQDIPTGPGYKCLCPTVATGPNCGQLVSRPAVELEPLPVLASLPPSSLSFSSSMETDNEMISHYTTETYSSLEPVPQRQTGSGLTSTQLALVVAFGVIGPCFALFLVGVIIALRRRRMQHHRRLQQHQIMLKTEGIPTINQESKPQNKSVIHCKGSSAPTFGQSHVAMENLRNTKRYEGQSTSTAIDIEHSKKATSSRPYSMQSLGSTTPNMMQYSHTIYASSSMFDQQPNSISTHHSALVPCSIHYVVGHSDGSCRRNDLPPPPPYSSASSTTLEDCV